MKAIRLLCVSKAMSLEVGLEVLVQPLTGLVVLRGEHEVRQGLQCTRRVPLPLQLEGSLSALHLMVLNVLHELVALLLSLPLIHLRISDLRFS